MVLKDIKISTIYNLLCDIKPNVEFFRIILQRCPETGMFRFKVILNEWKVDEMVLFSKPYANRQSIFEIMHDFRILYNLKVSKYEKD